MAAHWTAQHSGQYRQLWVAVLTAGPSTGEMGGAQRFYDGLLDGLLEIGCRSELVSVPADEPFFDAILENYERLQSYDLSSFDVEHARRNEGKTSYTLSNLLKLALDGIISFSNRPLYISVACGAIMALLSTGYALYQLTRYVVIGSFGGGPAG